MFIKSTLLASLAVIATIIVSAKENVETLIVNGTEVPPGKYEFMVGLRESFYTGALCGGSLVDPTHVLTAAHCFGPNLEYGYEYVQVGGRYTIGSSDGYDIRVKNVIIHPNHDPFTFDFDFAIIELEEPVDASITPVKIANDAKYEKAGSVATVAGWGTLFFQGPQTGVKMEVDVPIVDREICAVNLTAAQEELYDDDYYGTEVLITPAMVCAGGGHRDACQGDSGGPLFVFEENEPVLVGVVSFGFKCAQLNTPGVYARVTSAVDFILEHTSAEVANDGLSASPTMSPTMPDVDDEEDKMKKTMKKKTIFDDEEDDEGLH